MDVPIRYITPTNSMSFRTQSLLDSILSPPAHAKRIGATLEFPIDCTETIHAAFLAGTDRVTLHPGSDNWFIIELGGIRYDVHVNDLTSDPREHRTYITQL